MITKAIKKLALFIVNQTFITPILIWYFKFLLSKKSNQNHQKEITVAGFLNTATGLSKSAKINFYALKDSFNVALYDFKEGYLEKLPQKTGTIIFYCNPPYLLFFLLRFPKRRLMGAKIIINAFWETEIIPENWVKPLEIVDEIWVSNEFVKSAFNQRGVTDKIKIIPTPLTSLFSYNKIIGGNHKKDKFQVLAILDFKSNFERKNPLAIINAFKKAFGNSKSALLTLKISSMNFFPAGKRKILEEVQGFDNILILEKRLTDGELLNLMSSSDVIISLHRSEGFGLVMAEAMLMGKPVIATAYSGNMDFMNKDVAMLVDYKLIQINDPQNLYSGKDRWADPDYKQAAQYLRLLKENEKLRLDIGKKAKKHVTPLFSTNYFLNKITLEEGGEPPNRENPCGKA